MGGRPRGAVWTGAPVWLHGDLLPSNLLIEDGRLSGVIDFGSLDTGDPACDLMPAWSNFEAHTRDAFHAALSIDDATWARGRGWELSWALIALPYYLHTNPEFVTAAHHTIAEVLSDRG